MYFERIFAIVTVLSAIILIGIVSNSFVGAGFVAGGGGFNNGKGACGSGGCSPKGNGGSGEGSGSIIAASMQSVKMNVDQAMKAIQNGNATEAIMPLKIVDKQISSFGVGNNTSAPEAGTGFGFKY
jgi:hypothetical protein